MGFLADVHCSASFFYVNVCQLLKALSSPRILAQETEKVVTCCLALIGQHRATRSPRHARHDKPYRHDSHDTCSGASVQRGLHLAFSRSCSWAWCRSRVQKTKLVHASNTASSFSSMLEQATAWHARLDARDMSCVSCRDVTQQVEFLGITTNSEQTRHIISPRR